MSKPKELETHIIEKSIRAFDGKVGHEVDAYYEVECVEKCEYDKLKAAANELADAVEDLLIDIAQKEHCYFVNTDKAEQALNKIKGDQGE